jgi:hypothetical protein
VIHPLLFSHCKRIHRFRHLISENGFFVKCTIICTDDILFAKSYAVPSFSVDFISNIYRSIHYKEHFIHFLYGHVDNFAFSNMSRLQHLKQYDKEVSIDLIIPIVKWLCRFLHLFTIDFCIVCKLKIVTLNSKESQEWLKQELSIYVILDKLWQLLHNLDIFVFHHCLVSICLPLISEIFKILHSHFIFPFNVIIEMLHCSEEPIKLIAIIKF